MLHTDDTPAPERATAWLVPDLRDHRGRPVRLRDASGRTRFTLHHYTRTEVVHGDEVFVRTTALGVETGHPDDVAYRFIYACAETGAERAYGFDGPDTPGIRHDDEED